MTVDQVWAAIGAPDNPGALLPRMLDDLVERGVVESRYHRVSDHGPLREFFTLIAAEPPLN